MHLTLRFLLEFVIENAPSIFNVVSSGDMPDSGLALRLMYCPVVTALTGTESELPGILYKSLHEHGMYPGSV
jgi:hypothetical protein